MAHRRRRAHTRGAILVLYLLILIEDAGRKMFGLPDITLLAKDAWLIVLYLAFLPTAVRQSRLRPYAPGVLAAAFSLWLLLESTTATSSPLTLLLGVKTYLLYVPLVFIAEYAFTGYALTRLYLILILTGTTVALGAILSKLLGTGAPSLLQPLEATAGVHSYEYGLVYLAPSFFATAEKAADQLLVSEIAALCLYLSARRRQWRIVALVGLFVITAGLVAAARRLPLLLAVAAIALTALRLIVRPPRRRHRGPGRPARAQGLALLSVATIGLAVTVSMAGIKGYLDFLLFDAHGARAVIAQSTSFPGAGFMLEGRGTGTLSQGVDRLNLPPGGIEGPSEGMVPKVWQELGFPGFVMYVALLGVACTRSGLFSRPSPGLDNWGPKFVVCSILLMGVKAHQTFDNSQVQVVFWLTLGALASVSDRYAIGADDHAIVRSRRLSSRYEAFRP